MVSRGMVGGMLDLFCWHMAQSSMYLHMKYVCEAQPPEFSDNKLASLEVTRVSGSFMVMAVGKDGTMEGICWGNIL